MPKIVDYDKVKSEIANAATRVFIKKGYHKTTMADISKRMKLGRTSIYQYFDNKNEIFVFILDRVLDHMGVILQQAYGDNTLDAIEKINKLIHIVLSNYFRHRELTIMTLDFLFRMQYEKQSGLPELNTRTFQLRTMFHSILEEGIKRNQIRDINSEGVAHLLFSLVRAFIVQRSLNDTYSRQKAMRAFNDIINGLSTGQ